MPSDAGCAPIDLINKKNLMASEHADELVGLIDECPTQGQRTTGLDNLTAIKLFQIQQVTISADQEIGVERKGRREKRIIVRVR